jgi:hypothetical protein
MVKQQMILVAFMQASNCSNYPASWRHAQTASGFMTAGSYQNIARILEAGKFHLAFFDDRLVVPELQRRELFQRGYAGCALRENLGLPHPAWRTARGK